MKIVWHNVPEDIKPFIGFVYCIHEKDTDKTYYGIKKFWEIRKLPPLKGRSIKEKMKRAKLKGNKRHKKYETDWKTYKTSSPLMQKKLTKNPSNYRKTILKCCESVSEMKAWEAYYQLGIFLYGDWDKCYNEMINLRVRLRK